LSKLSNFTKPPPPSISDRDKYEEALREHIKKIVTPIFLKEVFFEEINTMGVGFKKIYRYRPNNYSIKMPLKIPLTQVHEKLTPVLPRFKWKYRNMKGWKGIIIFNYHGCTIDICPKQIIFYLTEKIERLVPYPHTEKTIKRIKNSIIDKIIDSAKKFKKETKIKFETDWKTHRKEIEIKGDEFIDSIPKDMNIHAETFKKVYDKGVEFLDEVNVTNYINNRALEDLSPELVKELINLRKMMASSLGTMNAISNTQLLIAQTLKRMEEKS